MPTFPLWNPRRSATRRSALLRAGALLALGLTSAAAPPDSPPRAAARGGDDEASWQRLARKTRIVLPEVQNAFYRSGGRYLIGRKVYLHVDAATVRRPPTRRPSPQGEVLIFENRSVPLVVPVRNRYWQQVARHLDGARTYSVRGILRIPKHDPRRRVHLYVQSIKRTPGTWK